MDFPSTPRGRKKVLFVFHSGFFLGRRVNQNTSHRLPQRHDAEVFSSDIRWSAATLVQEKHFKKWDLITEDRPCTMIQQNLNYVGNHYHITSCLKTFLS